MPSLMDILRSSRLVSQLIAVQPQKATVEKTWYKEGAVARQPGAGEGYSLHATTDILSAPAYGSTTPGAFITIEGTPPASLVVGQVAGTLGSNAPEGVFK